MKNVSFLGHLCGILSGFVCEFLFEISLFLSPLPIPPFYVRNSAEILKMVSLISDTYGLFNFLMPGTSFYSAIEASSWLVSIFMKAPVITKTLWEMYNLLLAFLTV